ncbi:extracellular catalytic domain type 1 short-chain-length polyhydroxyalkanoate depolymerase [Roseomonas rosulenta]|uniref:extracellular catalytic domain type 1 short-chain-length polyhydroxyalkanoate depolymerase n=1 Tax=Roseomonas rosulenta TaxID=2748667 RepID=UPI0018DFA0F0|nr:PHB depolymerase family esterase [Roseomonas rosulenta]
MNETLPDHMLEATLLTRAGKLTEATALLQSALRGDRLSAKPAAAPGGEAHAAPGRRPRIIDVDPETGEATVPAAAQGSSGPFGKGASPWSIGRRGRAMTPPLPEALRGFLDQIDGGGLSRTSETLPDGAQFVTRSFSNHAGRRNYKLYIPSTANGESMPLVVMLHGCTQSPDDFAAGTRMNMLAEEHGCLIAYPDQAHSANAQKCWNWFSPGDQQRDRGEPALIAGITQETMRDHAVDGRRVYVAGLSAGGAAAAIMASAYPDLYAAVGVHSGLACGAARDMPSAFAAMRQGATDQATTGNGRLVPTIVFHADKDSTVHPRNGDQVIAQSAGDSALRIEVRRGQVPGGRDYTLTTHIDAAGQAVLEQWLVHGGGHAWSGGSAEGSYTDPRGPDASREMLRFFLQHSLEGDAF